VHGQWKAARDRPSLLQADRALAFSYKQNQLAVEDLIAKAELALEQNKLDASRILFEQAQTLDPHSAEANGGLLLVNDMRAGKKTRQQLLAEVRKNIAKRTLTRLEGGKRKIIVLDEGDVKACPRGRCSGRSAGGFQEASGDRSPAGQPDGHRGDPAGQPHDSR